MELINGIVSDKQGDVVKERGKHSYYISDANVKDPYRFYVKGNKELTVGGEKTTVYHVQMVTPLGGTESGLFRFPKVGDRVLIAFSDGIFYLMGYVPSHNLPFNEVSEKGEQTEGILEAQGEVFRYRKTGDNDADDEYSEIGFYNEQTQWKGEKDDSCPAVDRINIQSTGDIKSKAQNHHQIRAKRFELFADCDDIDHSGDDRPFGDREGDDSALYAGDAHIRAKNRIVIKAGQEIVLQVGRSAIIIADDGITITSRKTHSNVTVPWDTVISLTPRDGLAMFGQKVDIGAAYDFSLRESTGGSLSSFAGIMRLNGKDILAQSYSKTAYQSNMIDAEKIYNNAVKAMQSGKGELPSFTSLLPSIVGLFTNTAWGYVSSGSNYSDPVGDYANYCGLLLQILSATCTVQDITMPAELREKGGGRDALILAYMVKEFEIVKQMLTGVANAASPVSAVSNSFIHLTASASAVLCGLEIKNLSFTQTDAAVPAAGLNPSLLAKETGRLKSELGSWNGTAQGTAAGFLKNIEDRVSEGNLWALDIDEDDLKKLKEL